MSLATPGERFDDRFEIRGELGEGGFAVVYDAIEIASQRPVALKVLKPSRSGEYDRELRARFEREARLVAQLQSPHSVTLYGSGESKSGLLFLAFEHLAGEDLDELLERRGRLEPEVVVDLLSQVLGALQEAHTIGLTHRDIKPANIRILEDRSDGSLRAVLLDFGIARATEDGHPRITKTGELIGTPRYMSPEQLTAKPLGPASDIYSLGVVAFECLMGPDALPGNSWGGQLDRLRTGHIFSAPEIDRIGAPLLEVIQRMTARDARDRFQSASAVAAALAPAPATVRLDPPTNASTRIRRLALASLVVLVGVGLLIAFRTRPEEPAPPSRRSNPLATAPAVPGPDPEGSPDAAVFADAPSRTEDVGGEDGCGRPQPALDQNGMLTETLAVYVPPTYDERRPAPLIVILHSDHQTTQTWTQDPNLRAVADREGVVLAAPYDGSLTGDFAWRDESDRERVHAIFEGIASSYCVDRSRVYIVGHGDGARVAIPLSCEPWVSAVAISGYAMHAGELGGFWCGEKPAPAIWLHPTDSAHVPNEAGPSCHGRAKRGPKESRDLWLARNRCDGKPTEVVKEAGRCSKWGCAAPFEFCEVKGGRRWSGHPAPLYGKFLELRGCKSGAATKFPIAEKVWSFFSRSGAQGGQDTELDTE